MNTLGKGGYHAAKIVNPSNECHEDPTNESLIREMIIQRRSRQRKYYARLTSDEKRIQITKVLENKKRKNRAANNGSTRADKNNDSQIAERRLRQRKRYTNLTPAEKHNYVQNIMDNRKRKKQSCVPPSTPAKLSMHVNGEDCPRSSADNDEGMFNGTYSTVVHITYRRTPTKNRYAAWTPEQKQNHIKKVIENQKRKKSEQNISCTSTSHGSTDSLKEVALPSQDDSTAERPSPMNRYAALTHKQRQDYIDRVIQNRKRRKQVQNVASTSKGSGPSNKFEDDSIPSEDTHSIGTNSSTIAERAPRKNRYAALSAEQRQDHIQKVMQNRKSRKSVRDLPSTSNNIGSDNNGLLQLQLSQPHKVQTEPPCTFCLAKRLEFEPPTFCCQKGKVHLPVSAIPDSLYKLSNEQTDEGLEFRRHIQAYNSIFSFTSMGVKLDKNLASSRKGVYTFRVQGQIYHDLPALIPSDDFPCYFQLYFYDTDHEIENRLNIMKDASLSRTVVEKLRDILFENPYAQVFRRLADTDLDTYEIRISSDVKLDQRVYNRPTADQVAATWIEGNNPNVRHARDIIVHSTSGRMHRVQPYFGCYDPLQYPVLFPRGEVGWHQNILKRKSGQVLNADTSYGDQNSNSVTDSSIPSSAEAILRKEK